MRQGTIVTTPPTEHPLSVADAKLQLRIDPEDTDQDAHIGKLCASAHRKIEHELGYPILQQTRQTHLFGFPVGPIWLGGGAGLEVTALRHFDATGTLQTVASTDYVVDAISRPATVAPAPTKTWPSAQRRAGAVQIDWTAGWANPAAVPEDLLHAMKLLVGHWDQNREAVIVGTISSEVQIALEDILRPFRLPFIA